MHIPDGMLSPSTSAVCGVAMLPIWAVAAHKVRRTLRTRQIPLLALGAAFCFTVMMFNIPAPGGTTAHPVAGTLLAILLGPWAAVIGVSVALAIQALFFSDGGLLAYGANCFTMAFTLPFIGYSLYRLLSRRGARSGAARTSNADSAHDRCSVVLRSFAAGIGAYIGINVAAATVAILLGIQPALFHSHDGHALYFPFGLAVTLPAMLGTHLVIAGPAEAIVTALVVAYLGKAHVPLYMEKADPAVTGVAGVRRRLAEPLAVGLLAMVALTPLGILANSGAWGEWGAKDVADRTEQVLGPGKGYVPIGIARAEGAGYHGVKGLRDYGQPETGRDGPKYVLSAIVGVSLIAGLLGIGGRLLVKNESERGVDRSDSDDGLGEDGGLGEEDRSDDDPPGAGGTPPGEAHSAASQEGAIPDHSRHPTPHPPDSVDLPDWLKGGRDANDGSSPSKVIRRSNPFLERTLGDISNRAAESLHRERFAHQAGYLQQLDPRGKVVALMMLIVAVSLMRDGRSLIAAYLLVLILAYASRLPLGMMVRRVWLSVPFFVGMVTLPAALNLVSPGPELLTLWRHPHLAVTKPGLALAALLTFRVGVAVSLGALLTLTTTWNDLLRSLRSLLVPRVFVSVLTMTYRYVVVLLQTAGEMFVARRSRTVGAATAAEGRRFVGASMGALFGKSLSLSEEIHGAMISRGFDGDVRTLSAPRWRSADTLWVLSTVAIAAIMLYGERV